MPKSSIAIHILADGRVVFGDLPPQLAQVADVLAGSRQDLPDSAIVAAEPVGADVEQQATARRCGGDGPSQTRRATGDPS